VVVVADTGNHRLSLWRLGDGTVWKHLGSQGTEPGQFFYPRAVAVTGVGALVVTDEYRVQVLTVDGAVLCVLDPTAVVGVGRLCINLYGVALYPGTDEILVTDYINDRVVALSWSPEVCYYEQCCFPPSSCLVDIGLSLFCLLYSEWPIGCAGIWQSRRTIGSVEPTFWCRSHIKGGCLGGRNRKSSPGFVAMIFPPPRRE
jgi:hypothetical protein